MGYRRFFRIKHDADPATVDAMADVLDRTHNGCWKVEFLRGKAEEAMTWYEFEDQMTDLSRRWPDVTFDITIEDHEEYGQPDVTMGLKGGVVSKGSGGA